MTDWILYLEPGECSRTLGQKVYVTSACAMRSNA